LSQWAIPQIDRSLVAMLYCCTTVQ